MPTPWEALLSPGFKLHVVPVPLYNDLVDDLRVRARQEGLDLEITSEYTQQVQIDDCGPRFLGMPACDFLLDGLVVRVPAHDVAVLCGQLSRLVRRSFARGLDYYKLHGYSRCLVLPPDAYSDLCEQMTAKSEDAETLATQFMSRFPENPT